MCGTPSGEQQLQGSLGAPTREGAGGQWEGQGRDSPQASVRPVAPKGTNLHSRTVSQVSAEQMERRGDGDTS